MRKTLPIAAALLLALAAIHSAADAQLRPWEITIAGGLAFPMGELATVSSMGYHVQGSVGFPLAGLPVQPRADVLWLEVPDSQDRGWWRQVGGLLNAIISLPVPLGRPYVLGGAGLLHTTGPRVDHGDHVHEGEGESIIGFQGGAGVVVPLAGLSGVFEVKYLNAFGRGDATHFQSIPVTIGIRF